MFLYTQWHRWILLFPDKRTTLAQFKVSIQPEGEISGVCDVRIQVERSHGIVLLKVEGFDKPLGLTCRMRNTPRNRSRVFGLFESQHNIDPLTNPVLSGAVV